LFKKSIEYKNANAHELRQNHAFQRGVSYPTLPENNVHSANHIFESVSSG
jgi:hypothetical protein